jgi:alpha-tubulin suppressor-like RCC1 family protein
VQVIGLTGATQIAAGEGSSYAVADGRLWAWGGNYFGQLDDDTRQDRAIATPVAGLAGVTRVAPGLSFDLALVESGLERHGTPAR